MAKSPGHRLGQLIGDALELAVEPSLRTFLNLLRKYGIARGGSLHKVAHNLYCLEQLDQFLAGDPSNSESRLSFYPQPGPGEYR